MLNLAHVLYGSFFRVNRNYGYFSNFNQAKFPTLQRMN